MSLSTVMPHSPSIGTVPQERRVAPRHGCLREIICQAVMAGKDENVPALLEDFSTGGLRLVLRRCYEPGRILAVTWRQPLNGPRRTVLAQVIYARDEGEGNWVVGCALMNGLSKDDLKALL